jgi:hypothetical protein
MNHSELVFEALSYYRNVGADPSSIRSYVAEREREKGDKRRDLAALAKLEVRGDAVRVWDRWHLTPQASRRALGRALPAEWKNEDAWILLAILYGRSSGACELGQIVAVADFINHAIPTLGEMHGALNRLHASGLIRVRRDCFEPTKKALVLFAKVHEYSPKRLPDQWDGLSRMLRCPCCGARLKTVRWSIPLSDQEYREVASAYIRGASARS